MDEPGSATRGRDPERTRQEILDAAEMLFADKGYESTSLQEIGGVAGFSRGTPGYFFGSKALLYEAVLERAFDEELAVVGRRLAEAVASGAGPEAELTAAIEGLFDFVDARPNFLRLVEREALGPVPDGRGGLRFTRAMQDGLAVTADLLARGPFRPVDPAHLLLDVLALCWFPAVHAETFVRALGLDPDAPSFKAARKRHVVEMVLRSTRV
jgi:AcrR family transcriptional regulator